MRTDLVYYPLYGDYPCSEVTYIEGSLEKSTVVLSNICTLVAVPLATTRMMHNDSQIRP